MRKANIYNYGKLAGVLIADDAGQYQFEYLPGYDGPAISLTMPKATKIYHFNSFPPFFDGLLPEGNQLEALLKLAKLDRNDLFAQLITVGKDLVGSVSVELADDKN